MKIGRLTATSVSIASVLTLTACSTVEGITGDNSASNTGSAAGDSGKTMVTVVRVKDIAWFDRMDVGVKRWGADNGYDTRAEGGTDAAPEKQIQIIQDLITQKPVAIAVVPNSPEALSAVLEQAHVQDIEVVSHEATDIKNVDMDVKAFDSASYGVDIMKNVRECTGGTGKYVRFVGDLTAKTHMEWVEAVHDCQQRNFPDMEHIETPIKSTNSKTTAYKKTRGVLGKHPDIKAFQSSADNDVPGIVRAIEEAGPSDQVCIMGTSILSASAKYLATGSINKILFWDPALTGKAQLQITKVLADGGTITKGADLDIEGYNNFHKLDGYDNVRVGNAQIAADAEQAKDYDF